MSLPEVVAGLNALGVSARDMIDILKSIKAAAGDLTSDESVREALARSARRAGADRLR